MRSFSEWMLGLWVSFLAQCFQESKYDRWDYKEALSAVFKSLKKSWLFPACQLISPLAVCGGFSSSGALYLHSVCLSDGIWLHHRAGHIKRSQRDVAGPAVRGLHYINGAKVLCFIWTYTGLFVCAAHSFKPNEMQSRAFPPNLNTNSTQLVGLWNSLFPSVDSQAGCLFLVFWATMVSLDSIMI